MKEIEKREEEKGEKGWGRVEKEWRRERRDAEREK